MRKLFDKQKRIGGVRLDKHTLHTLKATEHAMKWSRFMLLFFSESCPSYFSIVLIKHYDQQQLGKERVYFSLHFRQQFLTKGSQDRRSSRAGSWR